MFSCIGPEVALILLPCFCLRSIGEESFAQEIFEEHVLHLQEKAKEKERKREEEKVTELLYMFE